MVTKISIRSLTRWGTLVLAAGLMAGCSGSDEDVRIRLCKDLASTLTQSTEAPIWKDTRVEMSRAEQLVVLLSFDAQSPPGGQLAPMKAACYYRHDAVDETALTVADPMSAYSTSPYRMTLNGKEVRNPRLAEAIKRAMLKQGRELLDRAQEGIQSAARAARERLEGGTSR